jgi:hypothetical protein
VKLPFNKRPDLNDDTHFHHLAPNSWCTLLIYNAILVHWKFDMNRSVALSDNKHLCCKTTKRTETQGSA